MQTRTASCSCGQLSIEVNICDFDDDIYGQPIALDFIKFLRLEFKLGSIDELRAQLTADRNKSRAILSAMLSPVQTQAEQKAKK